MNLIVNVALFVILSFVLFLQRLKMYLSKKLAYTPCQVISKDATDM